MAFRFLNLPQCRAEEPTCRSSRLTQRSWHRHLSLGAGAGAQVLGNGDKAGHSGLVGLSGRLAPPCVQCVDPEERNQDGTRLERSAGKGWTSEEPTKWAQGGHGPGLRLWAALRPLQVSSQPWWEALGDKLPRRGGWKVCPGRWVTVSLLQVRGQRAFPPDLVPRPEALDLFLRKINCGVEDSLGPRGDAPSSSECAKSWAVMGTMCPAEALPASAIRSP